MARDEEREEVELSLLGNEEREEAARDLEQIEEEEGIPHKTETEVKPSLSTKDKKAIALLVMLCALYSV